MHLLYHEDHVSPYVRRIILWWHNRRHYKKNWVLETTNLSLDLSIYHKKYCQKKKEEVLDITWRI